MTDPIGTAQDRELEIQVRAVLSEHFGGAEFRQSRPRFTPAAKQIVALVQSRIAEVGRLTELATAVVEAWGDGADAARMAPLMIALNNATFNKPDGATLSLQRRV